MADAVADPSPNPVGPRNVRNSYMKSSWYGKIYAFLLMGKHSEFDRHQLRTRNTCRLFHLIQGLYGFRIESVQTK